MVERTEINIVSKLLVYTGIIVAIVGLLLMVWGDWQINQANKDLYEEKITTQELLKEIVVNGWYVIVGKMVMVFGFIVIFYGIFKRLHLLEFDMSQKTKTPAAMGVESFGDKK